MAKSGSQLVGSEPTVEEILKLASSPSKKAPVSASDKVSVEEILQTGKYAKSPALPKKATKLSLTPTDQQDTHEEPVRFVSVSGRYSLAQKVSRPVFKYDGGFVEAYGRREPTAADYVARAKWKTMLEGAEKGCGPLLGKNNPVCHNEDQSDGIAAYRYYWEGKGKDRYAINYEKYLASDPSAKGLIEKIVDDFVKHVEVIGQNRTNFIVISGKYAIGNNGFGPYPKTVNWRRTIGAHLLWVSAHVSAQAKNGKIMFTAEMVVHMEDKFNFNPYDIDLDDGISDAENGRFELVGWAHPYMNYASIARKVTWFEHEGKNRLIEMRPVPPPDILSSAVWD